MVSATICKPFLWDHENQLASWSLWSQSHWMYPVSLLFPLTCIAKLFVESVFQMQLGGSWFDGLLKTEMGKNYKIQQCSCQLITRNLNEDVCIIKEEAYRSVKVPGLACRKPQVQPWHHLIGLRNTLVPNHGEILPFGAGNFDPMFKITA